MESIKIEHPQLAYEAEVLKYFDGGVGIPKVYFYTHGTDYNFMVFELLGPSLEVLFNKCNKHFSLKTILMLEEQMVRNELLYHYLE